ncbi:MAG: flagellar biosynthesis protein FlhB [Deltaproteobacteria bacterium]|jgi:flagellar biosynthetic protein FlhB|nr:flagellar biosynthesis protein FlhB [Deltaproteobacteria bacterium]
MSEETGEKTEDATGHKLTQAREKGQVPKSMEINAAVVLLVAGAALAILGPLGWERLVRVFRYFFWRFNEISGTSGEIISVLRLAVRESLIIILPFAIIILIVAVAINVYQIGGFMMVSDSLIPKLDRLNFINGFGRLFKIKTVVECLKSIFKMTIIFLMGYLVVKDHIDDFILMVDMTPLTIGITVLKISLEIFIKTCLLLLVLAVLDYGYQRWQFMQDMKMTKQEVKDEYKQIEGDPIVKNRIRQAQREASKKRQLNDVPKADVVIANPTHFAVALMYDRAKAPAPMVVAKGQDFMAQRIKDIARENKVPIVENKPLAQALYRAVEVGQVIPVEFYKAVAEVLNYIYRVKGRRKYG